MDKSEIIRIIEKYKLDKSRFIVISGAALVLQEFENTTSDIDIWCDNEYYDFLLNNYDCELDRINEFGEKAYLIDNIINFGVSFMPKEFCIIDGIQCSSIKDVLELKKFLNRSKDNEIIKRLEISHFCSRKE